MTAPLLRFARYRDIAAEVATRLSAGGVEAIVASSGVASAITAEAIRNSPRGAVSLRLLTIEAFARQLVNDAGEYPRVATDAEQRLAMRSASRAAADVILDSHALAAMLQRTYRDVRDSGLTLAEFESRVRSASLRNKRRVDVMIRAWREYEHLIDLIDAVDPADVLLRAENAIDARVRPQIIAGFYDMTGAQLRLVHALAKADKLAEIFVPATEDEPFATRFVGSLPDSELVTQRSALPIKSARVDIAEYETRFAELRTIAHEIGDLIANGASPLEIGIVARSFDPYDIRLLHRFGAEFGFRVRAKESTPLIAHRIGRGIANLFRMRSRNFSRTDVIDLLRDGFATTRRIDIDAIDDETRRRQIAGGTGNAIRAVADYAAVVAEMEPLAPAAALRGSEWSALFDAIVKRFRIETESDAGAADRIAEVAAICERAEAWKRRFDAESVIDLLSQSSLTTGQDDAPSIWAGDVMRFRGRTFDHVFVARMQDDVFPQRRREDPLLPDSDRRALGLREIGDGAEEERLLFRLLHDGAGSSIHFTLAATDGLGNLLRPSPLLKHLAIEREPAARAEILRDFGKRFAKPATGDRRPATERIFRQLQRIAFAGTRSAFDGYLDLNDAIRARIAAALETVSPTGFEDFGECPQKFLWKRVLGVRDLDEPELELHLNVRDKGTIDHRILERFYRSLDPREITAAATLKPELRERLDALVDEEFDDFESRVPPFNPAMRGIERRATKRHLHGFIASDFADLCASGLAPAHFEYAFGPRQKTDHPEPYVIETNGISLKIEGRVDRIDADEDRLRVIDYKSGKANRHQDLAKKIDRGVRMQLALYAMAVADFFGRDESHVSGAIKPLRGGKESKFSFELAEHSGVLRETLDIFGAAILGGRFPAFPNDKEEQFDSCRYCPVRHSCRTKHDDSEKYAVTRYGDPRSLLTQ